MCLAVQSILEFKIMVRVVLMQVQSVNLNEASPFYFLSETK